MYPEYEKINRLFNGRCEELDKTKKEFKDIFEFAFTFGKNRVAAYYYDEKKNLRKIKYKEIEKNIYIVSSKLSKIIHANKDDFVILKIANSVDWIIYFYATLMAGYRVILLDSKANKVTTENFIKEAKAIAIICNEKNNYNITQISSNNLKSVSADLNYKANWANEIVFCSSGTTGKPKLVVYNGEAMVSQIKACKNMPLETKTIMYTKDMGEVKILSMIPFHHIFGFVAIFLWYSSWGSALVFPSSLAPSDIKLICQKIGITHVYTVPLFWNTLAKEIEKNISLQGEKEQILINDFIGFNLLKLKTKPKHYKTIQNVLQKNILGNKVKYCISGGGFLPKHTLEIINGVGYPLYNGYGMTELGVTSVELSSNVEDRLKNSIGKPLFSVEYKISNPDKNGEGQLLVKSPFTHIKNISENVEQKANLDEEGFFHTGDIVKKDKDNRYYIKGRMKDVIINSNGENIYPDELELHFKGLKHISNYSILGINKNENEQKTVIVLEVDESFDNKVAQNLINQIKNIPLPSSAKIDEVYFTKNKLPISSNLKVKRFEIKNDIEKGTNVYFKIEEKKSKKNIVFDKKTTDEIVTPLKQIFAEVLSLPEFEINNFDHIIYDLGGDSLLFVELCVKINEKFGIAIPSEDYFHLTTFNEFVNEIIKLKRK